MMNHWILTKIRAKKRGSNWRWRNGGLMWGSESQEGVDIANKIKMDLAYKLLIGDGR